jgi:RecB family exonuclease
MEEIQLDLLAPAPVAEAAGGAVVGAVGAVVGAVAPDAVAPDTSIVEERPLRLSYSSISTFELCPLQYKFKYVEREEGVRTPALAFGESLHEALRLFHQQPVPVAPGLGQLLGYLDHVWDASPYADEREEKTYKDHAHQVLAQYHRANSRPFRLPVAIEQRFEIAIGDVKVTGIIDRMDRHPDGSYEIIDYKTNRRLPPRRIVERDLQLSIYYLAAQEVWGITPSLVSMYYLLPGQKISATRTAQDASETRERILAVAARIEAGEFPPTENRLCNWCDYQAKCPLFANKFSAPVAGGADVAAAIDEWITLERRVQADSSRLRELEPVLQDYFDLAGVQRLFGSDAAITRSRRSEAAFDARAVREILEPLGLWDKVQSLDVEAVDELLGNGLPAEAKRALSLARAERSVWALSLTEPRR